MAAISWVIRNFVDMSDGLEDDFWWAAISYISQGVRSMIPKLSLNYD
jgi:hypothetical protein